MSIKLSILDIQEDLRLHTIWLDSDGKLGKKANFRRKNLSGLDLSNRNLAKADLRKTILRECNLSGTKLDGALLSEANVSLSNLCKATLSGATCSRTDFSNSVLIGITARATNFRNANFFKAKLQNSSLITSVFISTYFVEANLSECDLRRAKLDRANLTKANLFNSDLRQANLALSNLTLADLTGTCIWEIQNAEWNVTDTTCRYLYLDKHKTKRMPDERDFELGEFQDIYGNYPTIEYFFKNGITPIDPILLSHIVGIINSEHPDIKLELESLSLLGRAPNARFRISSSEKAKEILRTFIIKYETLKQYIANQKITTLKIEVNNLHIENFKMKNNYGNIGNNGVVTNSFANFKSIDKEQANELLNFIDQNGYENEPENGIISTMKDELSNVANGLTKEIASSTFDYLKTIVLESGHNISDKLDSFFSFNS